MVISGGNFKPDTLKPKEVVSLLLDDEEIEHKCNVLIKNVFFALCNYCIRNNNIIHFIDRQRNDEKRRFAQEENLRLEIEKERKRKATAVKVMIMNSTSNQYRFHANS